MWQSEAPAHIALDLPQGSISPSNPPGGSVRFSEKKKGYCYDFFSQCLWGLKRQIEKCSGVHWITFVLEMVVRFFLLIAVILVVEHYHVREMVKIDPRLAHKYSFPFTPVEQYSELRLLLVLSIMVILIFVVTHLILFAVKKKVNVMVDLFHYLMVFTLASLSLALLVHLLKVWVARPRPDFLTRCWTPNPSSTSSSPLAQMRAPAFPFGNLAANGIGSHSAVAAERHVGSPTHNQTSAAAPHRKLLTGAVHPAEFPSMEKPFRPKCTRPITEFVINDGMQSFPSGHSAFAWAISFFAFLYTRDRLALFVRKRVSPSPSPANSRSDFQRYASTQRHDEAPGILPRSIPYVVGLGLSLFAFHVSCSRMRDNRHHPEDVLAGGFLGSLITLLSFWCYYPIPSCKLQPEELRMYGEESHLLLTR